MIDFYNMFGIIQASGHLFGNQYQYVVADLATLTPQNMNKKTQFACPETSLMA